MAFTAEVGYENICGWKLLKDFLTIRSRNDEVNLSIKLQFADINQTPIDLSLSSYHNAQIRAKPNKVNLFWMPALC